MYNKKLMAVSLAVLLSLMFSLIFPVGVLADDGQPPAPEVTNPAEETSEEEGAAADSEVPELLDTEEPDLEDGTEATDSDVPEALDTEEPDLEEGTEATDSDASDAAPDETSDEAESPADEGPLLSQLPEGTEVVVLDEEGQVIPLSSQEADAVIAGSDPVWCPDGVLPGGTGCTASFGSFTGPTGLLTYLSANQPNVAGTIWIESTYNSLTAEPVGTTVITIDGGAYTTWRSNSLTIQGGWDPATWDYGTNTTTSTSLFFDDRFRIINWWNDVTVNNIVIDGGSGGPSLEIEIDTPATNTYNVTLENVEITDNTNSVGAFIDNDESTGSVTVNNSRFINNGNDDDGLQIIAMGNVTLLNVTATDNGDEGVQIDNRASSTSSTVQVLGTNVFTGNSGDGLYILSDGAITLNNITANNNLDNGIDIDNTSGTTNAAFTVTGTNSFSNNVNNGMNVLTEGAITLSNIVASGNTAGTGAYLVNDYTGAGGVTITGSNVFNTNYNSGLVIDSRGAVSIENVTASGNIRADGVNIDNCSWGGSTLGCLGSGDVTLTGVLTFNNNGNSGDNGLYIYSNGNVSMADVTATGNKGDGVEINNTSNTASTTTATVQIGGTNVFTGNSGTGLVIYSKGNIGLNNVTAGTNTGSGVYIENQSGTTTASVTLTGSNSFVGNTNTGLYVRSKGAITLSNVTANASVVDSGVWLDNDETGAAGGVTITGANNLFNGNNDFGLVIDSRGAVNLLNIIASGNKTESGVNIENCNWNGSICLGSGDVTLSGILQFTNNGNDGNDDGLIINSGGNVSMADVTATGNKDEGVQIDNRSSTASATVQIGGTNVFTGNVGTGLAIYSDGNVGLNNVTGSTNGGEGVRVENQTSTTNGTVTLTGTNSFVGNTSNGLYVNSKGAIALSNITANGSVADSGAWLDNDETGAIGGVTITGVNNTFNGNNDFGLGIASRGAVSLENVTANGNKTADGVSIDNAAGTGDVTLTGTQTFTSNGNGDGDDGLYIRSQGNVSLAGVVATGNKDEGVEIDNTPGSASATVQIGGTNVFSNNVGNGLLIYSEGNVGLNNVTANTNTNGNGVYIENYNSTTNGTVTLTGTNNFVDNRNTGLYVRSKGAITLSNITANGSVVDSGVWLDNDETGAVGGVTITGVNNVFSGNNDYGLGINSRGAISLENITASGNKTEDGVYIDNGNGAGSATLTGTLTFTNNGNDNNDDGLYIRTQGSLTLANVNATLNKDDGVEIDNTPGTGSVSVTGGTYNQNAGDGLYIRSDGLITLENMTANQNGDDGGDISNDTGGSIAGANVFVLNSTFNSNGDDGLVAASNLDVVLMNVTAQNNDNDGVELYSDGDNVALCGGVFSGNDIQAGSTDYNVRVTGGTRTRSSDIVVTNWSPTTGWTTVASGTGRCANTDNDVFPNNWDTDDDNDGVLDVNDVFPLDPTEWADADSDGIGDNADLDDDNDGVLDVNDAFPLDPTESTDTDGDGIGNNADTDDDNDFVLDVDDAFPLDPSESTDADGDGIGDNADPDDDNDGISDLMEIHLAKVEERKPEGSNPFNPSLIIPVTGAVTLSCTELLTALEMAGFEVAFDSLCGYSAGLGEITESELPGALPVGSKFISGIGIVLLQNGSPVNAMPADTNITLSFDVPSGLTAETLAVLYWDSAASAWVEKSVKVTDGKVVLTGAMPGTFVLVEK